MMQFYVIFIAVLGILGLSSCDFSGIPIPKIEMCTVLNNVATCTDIRKEEGKREYDRELSEMKGYQCTGITDYDLLLKDIEEKRSELAKLRFDCDDDDW